MNHQVRKIVIDIIMIFVVLLLMIYDMIDSAVHEWLGLGLLGVIVVHHILNRHWLRRINKGKYPPLRMVSTVLMLFMLLAFTSTIVSGVVLSRHVFTFLPLHGGRALARKIHMLSAFWGLIFCSLHLGFYISRWKAMIKCKDQKLAERVVHGVRAVSIVMVGYGIYSFIQLHIVHILLLKDQFLFLDYQKPVYIYLLQYLCIMVMFAAITHLLLRLRQKKELRKYRNSNG